MTTIQQNLRTMTSGAHGEMLEFQRRVTRVVASIVVQDNDGAHLCKITSRADYDGKASETAQQLLFGLVAEWSKLYNQLITDVRAIRFGQASDAMLLQMDVVEVTALSILSGLQALSLRLTDKDRSPELSNHLVEMKGAIAALTILQQSYELNPEDEVLEMLSC